MTIEGLETTRWAETCHVNKNLLKIHKIKSCVDGINSRIVARNTAGS